MKYSSDTPYRILDATIVLVILFLCVEALSDLGFLPEWQPSELAHFTALVAVGILFFAARLLARRARERERSVLRREKGEMARQADKAAIRYRTIMDCAGDAVVVLRPGSWEVEELNRKGVKYFGDAGERGLVATDLVPEENRNDFRHLLQRIEAAGTAAAEAIRFLRSDGTTFLGELTARVVDLGDERAVLAMVRDITQKQEAEREIRLRNRRLSLMNTIMIKGNRTLDLRTVLEVALHEAVEGLGAEGGAIHLFDDEGLSMELASGKNLPAGFSARLGSKEVDSLPCLADAGRTCVAMSAVASLTECPFSRAAAGFGKKTTGLPLFAKKRQVGIIHLFSGESFQFRKNDAHFFTTLGNQIGIMVEHTRLFGELKWKTEELERSCRLLGTSSQRLSLSENRLRDNLALVEQANLELEQLDRMKNQFLGMISHEFRTPLTGILSGTQYLMAASAGLGQEQRAVLDIIHEGGMRLHEIVNDLLQLARLEAKQILVNKTPLCLPEIFEVVRSQVAPLLEERRQTVLIGDAGEVPYLSADRQYLEEIMAELLKNAIKFTPDGGEIALAARVVERPELEAKREVIRRFSGSFLGRSPHHCFLQVEVRDTGIGIPYEEQVKIFEKFYEVGEIRHHSSGDWKFLGKGAGLGLAIVRGMVEAHDGVVWVESGAAGSSGSSFFVVLPLEEGAAQAPLPFGV